MLLETISLIASILSVILGLIAIALAAYFFVQGTRANTSAIQTLAKIDTVATTIQQHAFAMLEEAFRRIPLAIPSISAPEKELETRQPVSEAVETDGEKAKTDLNLELENMDRLYSYLKRLQQMSSSPISRSLFKMTGGEDAARTDIQRIRDLIAIKRAQLERIYGIDFNKGTDDRKETE
jgi:hypothetical protein